jgi:PKD repeat protein
MKKAFPILVIMVLALSAPFIAGTDYYIDGSNGNDQNDGRTLQTAWRTIGKANDTLQAGDTVYIRGGTYNENHQSACINPRNSGGPDNFITYTNYNNEQVIIGNVYQPVYTRESSDYICIKGLIVDGGSRSSSEIAYGMRIYGSHNIIQDCIVRNGREGPWGRGIHIAETSSYNQILNNIVHHIGQPQPPAANDNGDGIYISEGSHHNLVEGNEAYACGHTTILVYGPYNVIRHNNFHNEDWGRSAEMGSHDTARRHNVFEYNRIHHSDNLDEGSYPNYGMQSDQPGSIIRFNTFYQNYGHGLEIWAGHPWNGSHTRLYHNVICESGTIGSGYGYEGFGICLNELSGLEDGAFRDVVIKNNILYNNRYDGIYYKPQNTDPNDHTAESNFFHSDGNPRFLDEGQLDFHLQEDSPCIDAACWLTHTRSSGSGTHIPVGDASYFSYGYGIVEGDLIQLQGQSQTAMVVDIDYDNNILETDRSLNWQSNQGVSLAYNGSAPDIGAFEFGSGTALQANADATPTSGSVPLAVSFTGSAYGGTSPYSYSWQFGDGSSSSAQNPTHTYTQAGQFSAVLSVTDNENNQDTFSINIQVTNTTPVSAGIIASPTSGKTPLEVSFTGTASGGVTPYSYRWVFGDGGTSTAKNPSHTYSSPGSFTAVFTVTDSQSNQDSASISINVTANTADVNLLLSSSTGAPAPGQGGSITPSPGNHSYAVGSSIQLKATPQSNYRFSKWKGDVHPSIVGNDGITLTMNSNRSISALFCTRCGDVNGDLQISPLDAQAVFDIFLGRNANPTECQKENADVNTDGTDIDPLVTPADAQSIFNAYLGKKNLPGDCSCKSRTSTASTGILNTLAAGPSDINLIIDGIVSFNGDEVGVPVLIDNPCGIDAFGLDLIFPSETLEFRGVVKTQLVEGFYQVDGNLVNDGVVRLGGYGSEPIAETAADELVILLFKFRKQTDQPIDFRITNLCDDLKGAAVHAFREYQIRLTSPRNVFE